MTLGQKQRLFTRLTGLLIEFAYENGYELTYGDAYRDPRAFGQVGEKRLYSSSNSVHKSRLAVDFNLFKDGKFLTSSEDHRTLGEFWKTLHPDCCWGGDFKNSRGQPAPDGNHYSMEWQGRK